MRIGNISSHRRSATRPDAAPVHAVLPDQDGDTDDTCGHVAVKIRHRKLDALELEACPQINFIDVWRTLSPSQRQSSCRAGGRHVALILFIVAALEAARVRSPATLVALLCMLDVLTDVRSSRALRLWSAAQFLELSAAGGGGTQLSSALEHLMQRETSGPAQVQWNWP